MSSRLRSSKVSYWLTTELIFVFLFSFCLSCKCPLLGKVWEADLEACRMLLQSLQLQEARGSLPMENEGQMDDVEQATSAVAAAIPPSSYSEEDRKIPLQPLQEQKTQSPYPHCKGGEQKEVCPFSMAPTGGAPLRGALGSCFTGEQFIWGRLFIKPWTLWKIFMAVGYDYKINTVLKKKV